MGQLKISWRAQEVFNLLRGLRDAPKARESKLCWFCNANWSESLISNGQLNLDNHKSYCPFRTLADALTKCVDVREDSEAARTTAENNLEQEIIALVSAMHAKRLPHECPLSLCKGGFDSGHSGQCSFSKLGIKTALSK